MKSILKTSFYLITIIMLTYSCEKNNDGPNTEIDGDTGTLTDINGNKYKIVKIGDQWWMAENLKVRNFPDGTSIPHKKEKEDWGALEDNNFDKGFCYYNNNEEGEADKYGALYTYAAAVNGVPYYESQIQGVCPDGWHLPNHSDWTNLSDYIRNEGYYSWEGMMLKSRSGWENDGNGRDEYGFNALPIGARGYTGNFVWSGSFTAFWSSQEDDDDSAWAYRMISDIDFWTVSRYDKSFGHPVRCIMDIQVEGE